jgi:hypothetical protein
VADGSADRRGRRIYRTLDHHPVVVADLLEHRHTNPLGQPDRAERREPEDPRRCHPVVPPSALGDGQETGIASSAAAARTRRACPRTAPWPDGGSPPRARPDLARSSGFERGGLHHGGEAVGERDQRDHAAIRGSAAAVAIATPPPMRWTRACARLADGGQSTT